jgi:hypothetical protein
MNSSSCASQPVVGSGAKFGAVGSVAWAGSAAPVQTSAAIRAEMAAPGAWYFIAVSMG